MRKIIGITGCTSSGKTTIRDNVEEAHNTSNYVVTLSKSVSTTNRKARVGEVEGVDYYYVSTKEIIRMIKNNELIEYNFHTKKDGSILYYGTSKKELEKNSSDVIIIAVDEKGIYALRDYCKENNIEFASFYIKCSYQTIMKRCLSREGQISNDQVLDICHRIIDDNKTVALLEKEKDIVILENENQEDLWNIIIKLTDEISLKGRRK